MSDSDNLELPGASQCLLEPNENNVTVTALEKQIISAVVAGYTSKESAGMVGVSQRRLRHHIATIMAKLGVVNRLELVLVALHDDLIDHVQ